jgi:malonate transporter
MWALLLQFLPFFMLVALGWGATRGGLVPLAGIPALNVFVLYFGLPAMLFKLGASGALLQPGLLGLALVYALAGVVVVGLAACWARWQRWPRLDAAMAALATTFPNTGFLGLPLLTGLLGTPAAGPLAATILVDVLLFSTLCLAWGRPSGGTGPTAWRNPLLWSMAAGVLFWWMDGALPVPAARTVEALAQAASPVALFTLGAILARAQQPAAPYSGVQAQGGVPDRARTEAVWGLVVLKLVIHPALVWGLGAAALAAGAPLTAEGLLALTMAAALPAASNVSMLAERLGSQAGAVARLIWWSTLCALLSLSGWAQSLGVAVRLP